MNCCSKTLCRLLGNDNRPGETRSVVFSSCWTCDACGTSPTYCISGLRFEYENVQTLPITAMSAELILCSRSKGCITVQGRVWERERESAAIILHESKLQHLAWIRILANAFPSQFQRSGCPGNLHEELDEDVKRRSDRPEETNPRNIKIQQQQQFSPHLKPNNEVKVRGKIVPKSPPEKTSKVRKKHWTTT